MSVKVCSVEGCEGRATRRGWCGAHYRRWLEHGDPTKLLRGSNPIRPGDRFGLLDALREMPGPGLAKWRCRCDCGTLVVVRASNLKGARPTRSCRCLIGRASRHGMTGTPIWNSWKAMLDRVERDPAYRDVKVCARWDPARGGSFENFYADMGERPPGTSLGRYLDLGPYEVANTAWMTHPEQRTEAQLKRLLGDEAEEWSRLGLANRRADLGLDSEPVPTL